MQTLAVDAAAVAAFAEEAVAAFAEEAVAALAAARGPASPGPQAASADLE